MKKILITGANGFVGTNLLNYLRPFNELNSLSVRYIANQQFDIKADALIHLSGKAHDLKKDSHSNEYYEANFELTKQLYEAFIKSDAEVFIFMSTVKAVADVVPVVLSENEIPNPITHYGISKQYAESYILSQELPKNKRLYILRPCMIHGPGNKGNLNLLYKLVFNGIPWPLAAFENHRSFLSIENLCFVIKELLERQDIPSGVYNLADDDCLSTNELIKLLGESLGRRNRIIRIPKFLIRKVASVGDILKLPLNSESLQKLTESYIVSNKKIKEAIRKEFPISAKEGLLITFNAFKNQIK